MRTETEIQSDLDAVRAAIRRVLTVGQTFSISSGGGSSRSTTFASLSELRKEEAALLSELRSAQKKTIMFRAGW